MAIPRLRPSSPIDLNKNNAYKPPVPNIPLVAQQAIAAAHTGGSIPPMPAAKPAPQTAVQDPYAKAGFTSKEHYANSQQNRYNDAVTGGNNDLVGKLEKDALNKGYTLTKPAMPQSQPAPAPAPAGGSVAPPMPAMPNYNDIAAAEQARYLAERQRIADQQSGNITRAFERGNEIQRGNRVMEDLFRGRHVNPFGGRALQSERDTVRSRALADEASLGNFNAAIQGVEQGLANDRNTAAQEIMARAYELEQDAKRYGLDYAQIFGQGPDGGPRTLEATRFDRGVYEDNRDFDRGVLESDRGYDRGVLESDRDFDYRAGRDAIGDQRYDEEFDYRKAQDKFDQDYRAARDKIADERYKQEFDLDVKYRGLDYALRKAEQNNQLASGGGGTSDKALATAAKAENGGKALGGYQSDPTFKTELNDMLDDPATAIQYLRESEKEIIKEYGLDGFNALFNAIQAELTRRGMVS